jgi:hypothetical protein
MIVVGNLNILEANFSHEERTPFVIELLKTLKGTGAYKTFETEAQPEVQVGAIRDIDLPDTTEASKNKGWSDDEGSESASEGVVITPDFSTPEDTDGEAETVVKALEESTKRLNLKESERP